MPGPLLDRALDHVAGHARLAGLLKGGKEPRVAGRVGAAELRGDRDLLDHLSHDLALLKVDDRAFCVEPLTSHGTGMASSPPWPGQLQTAGNTPESGRTAGWHPNRRLRAPRTAPGCSLPAMAAPMMQTPENIQLIGDEIADRLERRGRELHPPGRSCGAPRRARRTQGERDVFGNQYGGRGGGPLGVRVLGWEQVGNYAIRFDFSDGHGTGLYTFDYLRKLGTVPAT